MKLEIKNGKSFWRLSEHEQEVLKPYGTSRTSLYFKTRNMLPLHSKEGFTLYHFYNRGPVYSDYIIIEDSALNSVTPELDRIPTIEVSLDNYTLNIRRWLTEEDRVPDIAKQIVKEYCLNNQTTNTLPIPIKYLKLYIAVLDEVNDEMVPTLVAHSMLGAHLEWYINYDGYYNTGKDLYNLWLTDSFRKCVVRVNRKEFEKISKLGKVYLGHENTTLGGEKSCAVVYPVWNDEVPNVLKFSKLWKPTVNKSIVYFDMDGVLADFEEKYNSIMSALIPIDQFNKLSKEEKDKIKEELFTYKFFRTMKPIQKGLDLLKYYQSKYEKVVILSATGNTSNSVEIEQAKRDWLQEHIGDIEAHFSDKAENKFKTTSLYSEYKTHILVDDRNKAIDPWIASGGIGILYI